MEKKRLPRIPDNQGVEWKRRKEEKDKVKEYVRGRILWDEGEAI